MVIDARSRINSPALLPKFFPVFVELTDALGLEAAPCEVGQTRARNGALQQVALSAAEEHGAADLFGGKQMSACLDVGQLVSVTHHFFLLNHLYQKGHLKNNSHLKYITAALFQFA